MCHLTTKNQLYKIQDVEDVVCNLGQIPEMLE